MLFLTFQIGDRGFALAADRIVEILPLLELENIGGVTSACGGLISYRGTYVPVVDLGQLWLGRPAPARMGTRIAIVRLDSQGRSLMLGLVVEAAMQTMRCEPSAFKPFAAGPRGLVQKLDMDHLISEVPAELLLAGESVS